MGKEMKKKAFAILGLGKFGASIAEEMARSGIDVLAVDKDAENVRAVSDFVTYAARADVCDIETMSTLGISNMDGVIVAITGSLEASVMGTILAKEAGVPLVLAKARDEVHAKILEKVGADRIIVPEKEIGVRIARCLINDSIIDMVELSDRVSMIETLVKKEWAGHTLRELHLRDKYKVNVVAMGKGDALQVNPDPDVPLTQGESIWVTVDKKVIDKLA